MKRFRNDFFLRIKLKSFREMKENKMAINLVPFVNRGIAQTFSSMSLALLKVTRRVDSNNQSRVQATLAVIADRNSYVKTTGKVVKDVNLGETFNVRIKDENVPPVHAVITNIKLINPVAHAVYGVTSDNSNFASINFSISADSIQLPSYNKQNGGEKR